MSMRYQTIRIFIAATGDWGVIGPFDLWAMAGFEDQHATQYLSKHFSREVSKFDLAEIMSKAINNLAGEEMSTAAGARLQVLNNRIHDLMTMFSVDSESDEADRLRQAIMAAARDVVAENYRGEGVLGETGEGRPLPEEDDEGEGDAERPLREDNKVAIVPRDPELWAKYLHAGGEEDIGFAIEKWLQHGKVLILDLDKPMLFDNEAKAEAWLAEKRFGPLGELPQAGARPPSPRREDVGQREERPPERREERPPERRREEIRPQPAMPPDLLPKMRDARELVRELASIRGSIESQTGFDFDPWRVQAAYAKMTEALGGGEPLARPTKRGYDPTRDDPMLDRLQGLLHDMLERRAELDAADMNTYPLQYLNEDLYEFLERHARAASCDVLRRRPNRGMPSKDGKRKLGPKGIALHVLKKEAIQLSKGNIRATKDGTITIDPGLLNCPVVREVVRQLETKASDMHSVRQRLDDLGMLVTQGQHGQVHVYCLVRSESKDGAKTKMCQWFIDAHGNDGKFKIECAKD